MKIKVLFLIIIFIIIFTTNAFAERIVLDRNFDDWYDKPTYNCQQHSEPKACGFYNISWYLDTVESNLYFYCNVYKLNNTGSFKMIYTSDFGTFYSTTNYDIRSSVVSFHLFDSKNRLLWNSSGTWCGSLKNNTLGIEFCLPIRYLVKNMTWGYLINFRFINNLCDIPRGCWLTVSTVSTFPTVGVGLCVLVTIGIPFALRKRKACK